MGIHKLVLRSKVYFVMLLRDFRQSCKLKVCIFLKIWEPNH